MTQAERESAAQQNNDGQRSRPARPVADLTPSKMRPPEFLKVRTADVGSVGAQGAMILALVRYMTSGVCGADGRRSLDGAVWWRVSMRELVDMLGGSMNRRTVTNAVLQLTESGRLEATPTRDFHGDRAKAYRVSDQPLVKSAPGPEQPLEESAPAVVQICTTPLAESAPPPGADLHQPPIQLEILEEQPEERGDSQETGDTTAVPGKANDTPKATATRGTRLDPEWIPPEDVIAAMRAECPDVDLRAEHRKFVDYWTDKTGAAATKRSWVGTWRNWIRRAAEQQSGSRGQARPKSKLRTAAELTARLRAEEQQQHDQQPSRKALEE